MNNMKLILEEWNKFVETIDNAPKANSLEEAIEFMNNYLHENQEVLDENLRKKITGALAGLMMMMGTAGAAQAADLTKPQLGMSNQTYVTVLDSAIKGEEPQDAEAAKEYKELIQIGQQLGEDNSYKTYYLKPAIEFLKRKGSKSAEKAAHVYALAKLNNDTVKEKPAKSKISTKDQKQQARKDFKAQLVNAASSEDGITADMLEGKPELLAQLESANLLNKRLNQEEGNQLKNILYPGS